VIPHDARTRPRVLAAKFSLDVVRLPSWLGLKRFGRSLLLLGISLQPFAVGSAGKFPSHVAAVLDVKVLNLRVQVRQ
jgi:hypothetical protein